MLKTGSCRSGRPLFLLLLTSSLLSACTETFEIAILGCRVEDNEAIVGAVLPYERNAVKRLEQKPQPGPFITVFFSAPVDLEAVGTSKQVHHVQYDVIACSSVPDDEAYIGQGDVYQANSVEFESLVGRGRPIGGKVYKVYIPKSLSQIGKRAEVYAALNIPQELQRIRSTGLCMMVVGGSMLGRELWSKAVRVPVKAVGDSLEISLETEQSTSTPEPAKSPEE